MMKTELKSLSPEAQSIFDELNALAQKAQQGSEKEFEEAMADIEMIKAILMTVKAYRGSGVE